MATRRKQILDQNLLELTLNRLCQQLIENHNDFEHSVIIGLQPRGVFPAKKIASKLESILSKKVPYGSLDITFYRDDFRRHEAPLIANTTELDFIIEDKKVVIIDDVLYTGRSVRAALDAMNAFGRPEKVELLVLVNRKYSRDLPIEPNYVGMSVNTMEHHRVRVEWQEQGYKKDSIWLVNS